MKLKEWRINKKLSQEKVAEDITKLSGEGVSQANVSYWESGMMPKRRAHRLAIIEYTKRKVTMNDFA